MVDHNVSTMATIWLPVIILFVCFADFSFAQGTKSVPVFTNTSALNDRFLSESLPIGYFLGTIQAIDPDQTRITYSIEGNGYEYFTVEPSNGSVVLKQLLDYENSIQIQSTLVATDVDKQRTAVDITTYVNDYNDNNPTFEDTAIYRLVPEDTPVNTTIAYIEVNDIDITNSFINVYCDASTPEFKQACQTFILILIERTNQYWRGNMILNQTLDYEEKLSYNIRLIAYDGDPRHNVSNEVHVEVGDVNDSPPVIEHVAPKFINEEEPIGTPIVQIVANDSDTLNKRDINYEICSNNTNLFQINNSTGVLSNAARLDYDDGSHEKGVPYDVCVKVREIINNITGQLGNNSITTATVNIKINIMDINDNGPVFNNKSYHASVNENTASLTNVPGLQMTVTDKDSEPLNSFNLAILNYTDVFGIVPTNDLAISSVTLYVKNGTKLDYESGVKQYVITVVAAQNFQNNRTYTSSATVIIDVKDVNDNTPKFDQSSYTASVSETAPPDTLVIRIHASDNETGAFGDAGIVYKLYGDNVPPNFKINEKTGEITVAPCSTPGQAPCIDYEKKKEYNLIVSATDNNGINGRTQSVPLNVSVIDANDNVPIIDSKYVEYIYENKTQTINPLKIQPIDPDGLPLTFSISGDASGLWTVTPYTDSQGRQYGIISAVKPVMDTDAIYPRGQFNFAVLVADRRYSVYANVTIYLIDTNNNAPHFIPPLYQTTIDETTKGDVSVMRITASDADSSLTGNGIIDFYLHNAQGLFTITNVTMSGTVFIADIYTTSSATFTYEKQNSYEMTAVAQDRGSPKSLTGTAKVIINIRDVNNKNPVIEPAFQSINVYENTPLNTFVYKVKANDPDVNSKLEFSMIATGATDGIGDTVNVTQYDYTILFRIDQTTGNVYVNVTVLDRDKASRITYIVIVRDVNGIAQSGNGTFLIHILEYNSKAPYFDLPLYNITIDEEMNINSFVLNLNCQDDDDKISGYTIKQDSPQNLPVKSTFFDLLPGSGAMIVNSEIDYEQVEVILLTATCTDDGQPVLSASVKVIVNIRNINDNTPTFNQSSYSVNIEENKTGFLIQTLATDKDKGDYGVVRYSLNDPYGYFGIDNVTGVVTILSNATLDREKTPYLAFQVVAYDSPLDPKVRKSSAVPVYVTLLDVNDNCPIFINTTYIARVPESARVGSVVIEATTKDLDYGVNAMAVYRVKNGSFDPPAAEKLFGIIKSGDICLIVILANLKGLIGTYRLNITATDMNGISSSLACTTEAGIIIEVVKSDNNAPRWINPSENNFNIEVLESQYDGMIVYSARAEDSDPGLNGKIDYYFSISGDTLVSATDEFKINIVTGVISAKVVFDREQKDKYYLSLVARDNGYPQASSEITVVVIILDVNDNDPLFSMKDGVVTPLVLPAINESLVIKVGDRYYLGTCNATDADSDTENNRIYYILVATTNNKVSEYIYVENTTCNIYLIKGVDFETTPTLEFEIYAYNLKNDDYVRRVRRETRPSYLPVTLPINNNNDNKPSFMKPEYLACVSVNAPFQQNIVQVEAKDIDDNSVITYSLSNTVAFEINPSLGIISNIISFSQSDQKTYSFKALASDGVGTSSADVIIFVTSPADIARVKVNRPLNDVVPLKPQLAKSLVDSSNGEIKFACVDDVRNYVDANGIESKTTSDALISAFKYTNGQYVPYSASELAAYVNKERQKDNSLLQNIYITDAQSDQSAKSFILEEDAVLAIFIICILLIFLAILLLVICCICIRQADKRKKKKIQKAGLNSHNHEVMSFIANICICVLSYVVYLKSCRENRYSCDVKLVARKSRQLQTAKN